MGSFLHLPIVCVAWEIEAGHAQAVLVGGIEVERASIDHGGHPDKCQMCLLRILVTVCELLVPGSHDDLLAVGYLQVEVASEVVVLVLIGGCHAHFPSSLF